MRTAAAALAVILVAGCGSQAAPAVVQPTPQLVYVTPEPGAPTSTGTPAPAATLAPIATPTPDPEALRVAAAQQYLAAARKANKASAALNKKFPKTFKTLKQARRYWSAYAKIDGTFLAEIKAITVPPDTAADMRDLIRKVAACQAIELEAANARSWTALASARRAMDRLFRNQTAAANLIRSDLGLPPVEF